MKSAVLLITHYSLLITYYSLLITPYSLLITHYLLLNIIASALLPIKYGFFYTTHIYITVLEFV